MPETGPDAADPDLLIDFRNVSLRRGGRVLVGPLDWAVELDERWVIIGPNGAGKTSLLRIAAAAEHPSAGVALCSVSVWAGSTCASCGRGSG